MIMKEGKESAMGAPPIFQHSSLIINRLKMQLMSQTYHPSIAMQ